MTSLPLARVTPVPQLASYPAATSPAKPAEAHHAERYPAPGQRLL